MAKVTEVAYNTSFVQWTDGSYHYADGNTISAQAFPATPTFNPATWNNFGWDKVPNYCGTQTGVALANDTGGYAGTAVCMLPNLTSSYEADWVGGGSNSSEPYALFDDIIGQASQPPGPVPPPNQPFLHFSTTVITDNGLAFGQVKQNPPGYFSGPPVDVGLWNGTNFIQFGLGSGATPSDMDNQGHAIVYLGSIPALLQATAPITPPATTPPPPVPLNSLLTSGQKAEVTFPYVDGIISNENTSDHSYRVLVPANNQVPTGQTDSQYGVFTNQPTLDPTSHQPIKDNWSYARMVLPANVVVGECVGMNPDGVITAVGCANTAAKDTNNNPATTADIMLLLPEDIIQVDAFIPQTWVDEPWFVNLLPPASYIDNGNSRKNPLDASLTSGSSIFIQNSPEFKVRQTINVCAFPSYDPDGSQEVATKKTAVGQTREYKKSVLVNGEIPSGATPLNSDIATPILDSATVTHPSGNSVKATLEVEVSNPLVPFSDEAPIHYQTTITIDRSNPSNPTCTVTGTNCRFPAYEIYINSQQVYHFDPIPQGFAPIDLTHYDRTYNTPDIPLNK